MPCHSILATRIKRKEFDPATFERPYFWKPQLTEGTLMKAILALALFSLSAQAAELNVIDLKVFPGAKVKEVKCEKRTNLNHDEATAGFAKIVTAEGKELTMNMVISRFSDEQADADALCKQL